MPRCQNLYRSNRIARVPNEEVKDSRSIDPHRLIKFVNGKPFSIVILSAGVGKFASTYIEPNFFQTTPCEVDFLRDRESLELIKGYRDCASAGKEKYLNIP